MDAGTSDASASATDDANPYLVRTSAILPSVFVLGPPKAASTFLWTCLMHSFHPKIVCSSDSESRWSDSRCGGKRFLLSGASYVSWWGACFMMKKEGNTPWTNERDVSHMRWHIWGGPQLAMKYWQTSEQKMCSHHRNRTAFAELVEQACIAAAPCAAHERPASFLEETKPQCLHQCDTCELHPGVDEYDKSGHVTHHACRGKAFPCESKECTPDGVVSSRLNQPNVSYRATHKRHFKVTTAFPHRAALARANISRHRLLTLDANPGLFAGAGVGLAVPMAASLSAEGRARMRFVVGYRSPLSLVLSTFAFYHGDFARIGKYMEGGIARARACEGAHHDAPARLLALPSAEWRAYRACRLSSGGHHVLVALYAVHLTDWLRAGFGGAQFLLVPVRPLSVGNGTALHEALGAFLDLPLGSSSARRMCAATQNVHRSTDAERIVGGGNKTAGQLRAEFLASSRGAQLRAFLEGHDALLPGLVEREGVHVLGGVAALATSNASSR